MTRSITFKLLISIALSIAVLLAVVGMFLQYAVERALTDDFDNSLKQMGISLSFLVETDGRLIESELVDVDWPQFSRKTKPEFYQVFDCQGNSVEKSFSLGDASLPWLSVAKGRVAFSSLSLPDRRPGRLVAIGFVPAFDPDLAERVDGKLGTPLVDQGKGADAEGEVATMVVARGTENIHTIMSRVRWLIWILTLVGMLVGLGVAWLVVRMGLSSLHATASQIETIDVDHLENRLDLHTTPTELEGVVNAANQMLVRLKSAFERERSFTSNVAHELRTPLAGMKSTLEVALSRPRDQDEYRGSLQTCLMICDQTASIVDNMLMLAKVDAKKLNAVSEEVDIKRLIQRTIQPLFDPARARRIEIEMDCEEQVRLITDPVKLHLILRNLFENAVEYAFEGSVVSIESKLTKQNWSLSVSNLCRGIGGEAADQMFDRFWRNEKARSSTGHHCGIGLALSRSLAEFLGGELDVTVYQDEQVVFDLVLPKRVR